MKRRRLTTVQLKPYVMRMLEAYARSGVSKSEVINNALKEYLLDREFQKIRNSLLPLAQARGIYTDEDVERLLS